MRHIGIHGDFPLFDDEVLRHITLRSGTPLPPDEELRAALDAEEERLLVFLQRDGYFGGSVKITPIQTARPEWIDLDVRMYLGTWYRLGGLRITGHTSIPADELTRVFDHCCLWWGRFRVDRMREDARAAERLLASRGYPAARVVPSFDVRTDADAKTGRVILPIRVTEKRKVEVRFVGNRSVADGVLKSQLTLFTAGAYDEIELAESAKALQRYYQTNGYFEARVGFEVHRLSNELEQVDFLIEEGPELKVRRVEIVSDGPQALHFSDDDIRSSAALETKVFPALGLIGLGEGGFVTSVQLTQDVDRIVEFYKARGFPQVRVRGQVGAGRLRVRYARRAGCAGGRRPGARRRSVRALLDRRGARRERFGNIDIVFVGPHGRTVDEIRRVLKIAPGDPYTQTAFGDAYRRLLTLYAASARPYLKIAIAGSRWDAAHANYFPRIEIDEEERVTFGEILIRGNFRTRARVIAGRPAVQARRSVRRQQDRRGRAQPADPPHLQHGDGAGGAAAPQPGADSGDRAGALLRAGHAGVRAGVGHRPAAALFLRRRRPVGAQLFRARLAARVARRLRRSHLVRRAAALHRPARVRPRLALRSHRVLPPGGDHPPGPHRTSFGASLALTRSITRALRVFGRYDFYVSKIGVGLNRIDGSHDLQNVSDDTETAKVTVGVTYDKRVGADGQPNPLMPHKGFLLSAAVGWAFPTINNNFGLRILQAGGGDHDFLIFSGQAVGLLPLKIHHSEITLIGNIRFDEGVPIGESALPLVERFYAGGDTTTRGYQTDELKTEIVRAAVNPLSGQSGVRIIPEGGNLRLLGTVELQFPISPTFLGLPWPWVGAVFYDVGAIANAPNLIAASDFKQSIGMSLLRVLTPFGPLSLEYAYPLNPSLADELWKTNPWYTHFPGRIHFNWGIPLSRL